MHIHLKTLPVSLYLENLTKRAVSYNGSEKKQDC